MAQELEPQRFLAASLPALNVAEPASMLLLPEWLMSQLGAVSDLGAGRTEVDGRTRQIVARVATIPRSKMPSTPQRQAIARRITELREAAEPGPVEDTIGYLGELIQEYAPSRLDPKTVSIKAEAYLDAVEDLPAWALREAIRRWRRGDVTADPQTLDFAPKPARLRAIADGIAVVVKGQALRLQRILDAEPEEPLTEAQMEANAVRMAAVLAELREPVAKETPVGTDAGVRASALRDLEARQSLAEQAEQQVAG